MNMYKVVYTAFEKGSSTVASEGTMTINAESAYMAEQTLKAIFAGLDVIIRYTNNASLHISKLSASSNSRLAGY